MSLKNIGLFAESGGLTLVEDIFIMSVILFLDLRC